MEERKRLYLILQKQVNSILPLLSRAERIGDKVAIGNVVISEGTFEEIEKYFTIISETAYHRGFVRNLRNDFMPLSLVSSNVFLREIQVTLNCIHMLNVDEMLKDEEK